MANILCTGGAGFIGSHLIDQLVYMGFNVTCIDNFSTGKFTNINEKANLYVKDIRDKSAIEKLFLKHKFDYVFHCAAEIDLRKSFNEPIESADTNIIGSLNLIEQSVKHKSKFIFSSTGGAIYRPLMHVEKERPFDENHPAVPMSPYGLSKLTIEKYLQIFHEHDGLDYVALRYSNVYGLRQAGGECGVLAIFLNKLKNKQKLGVFGSGEQVRDYVYQRDVVDANLYAMRLPVGVYNVSTGVGTSVNEIVSLLSKYFPDLQWEYLPSVDGEMNYSVLNPNKLIDAGVDWKPQYTLEQGLEEMLSGELNV